MKIEFRKAIVPNEIEALHKFDHIAFASFPADLFDARDWAQYDSYWMIVDGRTVGCSAFLHDVDYDEQPKPKCLWIVSTGILPEVQGRGFGSKLKEWQIDYARQRGFEIIVTNMRQSHTRIIRLNKKFGFTTRELVPGYYSDPEGSLPGIGIAYLTWKLSSNMRPILAQAIFRASIFAIAITPAFWGHAGFLPAILLAFVLHGRDRSDVIIEILIVWAIAIPVLFVRARNRKNATISVN